MTEKINSSFHLHFLIQLTRYLGFFPKNNFSEKNNTFDLMEGEFSNTTDFSEYFAPLPISRYIAELQNARFEMNVNFSYPSNHRNELLDVIIKYFQLHIADFGELKSHKILKEVLH